jgi:hypothetical protein
MLDVGSLPDGVRSLVWWFALAMYHHSATRIRHRRVLREIVLAAYRKDRQRHFARDTITGKWLYASWCNSSLQEVDVDTLQPPTFSVLESDIGMATPHEPAPSEGEYDCHCCDGCVFYCARCDEPYCASCDPDDCSAP